ncbi:hypothetical protein X777_14963 [Ooceraea biroi]|uniref:Uncharacterized protein n=1 Tax=Ooceraea biroi TaxID=2015173 RepID=A0A026WUK5_OOCBI|nr:hypothetical protein X777_14963 [Ooceraea biroi]
MSMRHGDRQTLFSMTNYPRTYPPKAGQLDAISARAERERERESESERERERERKREKERDLNAQRHECAASISTSIPIPSFGEEPACAKKETGLPLRARLALRR